MMNVRPFKDKDGQTFFNAKIAYEFWNKENSVNFVCENIAF